MAFESVNTTSLRNALNQCKNSINHNTSKELINSISNKNTWESESQENLKRALTALNDVRYSELEETINNYLSIVNDIERYQTLQKTNTSLRQQCNNLQRSLQPSDIRMVTIDGDESLPLTLNKNYTEIKGKISNLQSQISENNNEMTSLKNKIANSI